MRRLPILLASLTLAAASELHQAARTCDLTRFRRLLSEHPPLNDPDAAGITPLQAALRANLPEAAAALTRSRPAK